MVLPLTSNYEMLRPVFFCFGVTPKKNAKANHAMALLRACLPAWAYPVATAYFLPFGLLPDTLISVTFLFLAGYLAQFILTYRCEL